MKKFKNFESSKDYKFFKNLWNGIGRVGTLRRLPDGYDINIDLSGGYYLQIEKVSHSNDIAVSLCFTYEYSYKNVNIATMKVAFDIVRNIQDVNKSIKKFCENVHYYVLCRMNKRDVMLVVQENALKSFE